MNDDQNLNSKEVIVIGAGVSGLTTAYTLQALGYDTAIYTKQTADNITQNPSNPGFASLYPSASVIPHSVENERLESLFKHSQSFFYELKKRGFPGVTTHTHFEVFEYEKERPHYMDWMMNLQTLEDVPGEKIPRRAGAQLKKGWCYESLFADWPLYFPELQERYLQSGGEVVRKTLRPEDLPNLPASTIINCSGLGSMILFDDPAPHYLLRGHLLVKKGAPLVQRGDETISYNYTPEASVYADKRGNPSDVYFYPRKDGWLLGGSRQLGQLTKNGDWDGERTSSPSYEINHIPFPAQIYDLNKEIIEHSYSIEVGEPDDFEPTIGYRYLRRKDNGLRLEQETISGKNIIHNYGHGGAGVTLSWGCAFHIAETLMGEDPNALEEKFWSSID